MSSIPLPALDIRPPQQQENPIEQYGRIMQLKSLMAQQQMIPGQLQAQQQQLQIGQQQVQEGQMSLNDRKVIMDAYKQANGNLDKTIEIAAQNGISNPSTLIGLKKASVDQQMQNIALFKAKGEQAVQEANLMQGAHDTVSKAPPEQRPQVYQQQVQALGQAGIDVSKLPPQYPGDEQFAVMGLGLRDHTTQMNDLAKQAEIDKNTGEGFEAHQRGLQIQQQNSFGGTPEMQKSRYQFILSKIKAKQPVSPQDYSWAQAYEASEAKSTTQSDTLGVTSTNSSRPSGLAIVSGTSGASGGGAGGSAPNAKDSIVDMVGQYKLNPMMLQRMIVKHPDIIAAVGQKYPDFDQTNYQAKAKAMESFTSGPYSRQINATNVALSHINVAATAADALANGQSVDWNKLANAVGVHAGQDPVTTFRAIIHKVGPELAQAYIQGGGGEGERQGIMNDLADSLSPNQIRSNLATVANLLRPNIDTIAQQYKNTIGRDDFTQRFLTPEAQQTLGRFRGQGPAGQHGAAGNGPSPQSHVWSASAWKKANPSGNLDAAKAEAQQQGYSVVQ